MIEINLLPGKKRAAGAGFRLGMPDFRGLIAQVRDPWLIAAIVSWVLVGGGSAVLFTLGQTRLRQVERELVEKRAEKRKYDQYLAALRKAQQARDSLAAEIGVIRRIDSDRYVWPHILDQITKALPPYTWLTDVSAASVPQVQPGGPGDPALAAGDSIGAPLVRVSITGRTVDIQAFTTFLRQLAASPWLSDVLPAASQTRVEADRPVTEFNVTARYRVADSVYIRTVPIIQTVR